MKETALRFKSSEVFFILSVWRKIGFKRDGAFNYTQFRRFLPDIVAKSIPSDIWDERFSAFSTRFFDDLANDQMVVEERELRDIFPNSLVDIEDDILDLTFDKPVNDTNSKKMLYKVWRSNKIKRRMEKENAYCFDAVVRSRPEIILDPSIFEIKADLKKQIFVNSFDGTYCGDTFALSASRNLDIYSDLYLLAELNFQPWPSIHVALTEHLKKSELSISPANSVSINTALIDSNFPLGRFTNYLRALAKKQTRGAVSSIAWQILAALYLNSGHGATALDYIGNVTLTDVIDIASTLWLAGRIFPEQEGMSFTVLAGLLYSKAIKTRPGHDRFTRPFMIVDAVEAGLQSGFDLMTVDKLPNFLPDGIHGAARQLAEHAMFLLGSSSGLADARVELVNCVNDRPDILRALSVVYAQNKRLDLAIETARRAFRAQPASDDLLQHLAFLLLENGQAKDAIDVLTDSQWPKERLLNSPLLKQRLGDSYRIHSANLYRSGAIEAAVTHAKYAVDVDPTRENFVLHYCDLLFRSGKKTESFRLALSYQSTFPSWKRLEEYTRSL